MKSLFNKFFFALLALPFALVGCGGGGDGGTGTDPSYRIELNFERVDTGMPNPFLVTANLYENNQLLTGVGNDITITLGRGSRNAVSEISTGQYQFTVTPIQTGEHSVTVSYKSASIARTALVVSAVHPDWGQPMAVPGLVNTAGYEDGITITPDGEYLFVQYGPFHFSAFPLFNTARAAGGCEGQRLEFPVGTANRCTHTWLDNTIGPYTFPERPGFFDGRFSGTTMLHNANSWGVGIDQSPIFAPSTMFYGFKKQTDGSFAEPFYLAFDDDNDGLINPYGLSFLLHGNNTATILFALDDPSDPDMVDLDGDGMDDVQSLHDVYTSEITLGQNNSLGTYQYSGTSGTPPVRGTPFSSQLVDFGKTGIDGIAGTQGNPHLYQVGGVTQSIWTDDERDARGPGSDRGDLSVYVLNSGDLSSGSWTKVVLPSIVNQASPSDEIQPFFTGSGLYFTHSSDTEPPEIFYAAYIGTDSIADYQNAANWGAPVKLFTVDSTVTEGEIVAIGEPTLATVNGKEYLYFVYGYIRGFDSISGLPDIDMQAGFILKK